MPSQRETRPHASPAAIKLTDITADLILAFLDHLEQVRGNTVRSRNARLAALRTFLKFAARRDISALQVIERALGVPMKRFERPMLGFLSHEEMLAVIGSPGSTWLSQLDHLLLGLLYNIGARVSEVIRIRVADVVLDGAACIHLRVVSEILCARHNMTTRSMNAKQDEDERCHTTATHLLQSGVDISVIALWLGHESPTTTHRYIEADLAMKERALARLQEPDSNARRYRAPDSLMEFLKTL